MLKGNVKNAPEGEYFAEVGYTQFYPWKVISKSKGGKKIRLQKVKVSGDPEWHENMKTFRGGFAGHVANQSEQTWVYNGLEDNFMEIRLRKDGTWGCHGVKFIMTDGPFEFYDYNY